MTKNQILIEVYNSIRLQTLINNLSPEGFKDDLKQELFLILLNQDEEKIIRMHQAKEFFYFITRTLMNMSSERGSFSKLFKANRKKEKAYERFLQGEKLTGYCSSCVTPAVKLIKSKFQGTADEKHEAMIFEKYIEKRSCEKVALHFDIPSYHIKRIVKKVRIECSKVIMNEINT